MRVGLLSYNARQRDAIGNHVAETVAFFLDRGADIRLFIESDEQLHPMLGPDTQRVERVAASGAEWEYLASADLVIAQYAQFYGLLHFLPLLAGGKPRILVDYHGVTPPELWAGPNREALEQGQRQRGLVWCADLAIAHSDFTCRELIAATGFPAERVRQLAYIVDHERFRPDGDRGALRRRLGLADQPILLYVGRLAANKRVPLLVEALAQLPDCHAVVIGDATDLYAEEANRCRVLAEQLGVADRLHLLGQLSDAELPEAYRGADMLVIPSRHEGFCLPVVEAMACGLPVIAARGTALPETVGDGGLTFTADDADDLARQIRRLLHSLIPRGNGGPRPKRIAVACFRFGADIVGGAETSLGTIAHALQRAGQHVEVFTTCTKSEADWRNELPAGTTSYDGLTVHRFPIDAHDRERHLESVRRIGESDGYATPEQEDDYLRHSIHSAPLIEALRGANFDAIITGPYLFGLTYDIASAFPDRTLVLPCFHDEPLARLRVWPEFYGRAGGLLYHSPEEPELAQTRLGVNHPNAVEIGTLIDTHRVESQPTSQPYLVYCGRFSEQKNVPLLLDWMRRYQAERPGRFDMVFLGKGEVELPREPWIQTPGHVTDERKRAILAGARALVQLSRQESLSLVALEAWAQEVPVIVHADCAVLAGQVERSRGGAAVRDYAAFRQTLDDLWVEPKEWTERGKRGRTYVRARYASEEQFAQRLLQALANLSAPLVDQMRQRGLERAATCDRAAWRERFGRTVEQLLDSAPREHVTAVAVEPLSKEFRGRLGQPITSIPVRVRNCGSHAAVADGPGRLVLRCTVGGKSLLTPLPCLLAPGQAQVAMIRVPVPPHVGEYESEIRAETCMFTSDPLCAVHLEVTSATTAPAGVAVFLDEVRRLLTQAQTRQRLPDSYVDVTQGWFARAKRWVKKTLLNNFKRAYVDVLSRQQSQINGQLVTAVQQLAECCVSLDHAVRTMQQQLDDVRASGGRERSVESARRAAHAPVPRRDNA